MLLTNIICLYLFQKITVHNDDQILLKTYITEWRKVFVQCSYLPGPFVHFENFLNGTVPKRPEDINHITVRKVKCSIICVYSGI